MLASGLEFPEHVGGSIRPIVAVPIAITNQSFAPRAEQVPYEKAKSLRAGLGTVGELFERLGPAVAIAVDQNADIARAGDHHTTQGVDGHGIDVVGEIVIRV